MAETVLNRVIGRIVYEMECLYHVDTIFKTAENAVTNMLIPRIVSELTNQAIVTVSTK